jgi:hypothetical protein
MNYLKDLAGTLPEKKKDNFMQSDARLSMEYVINTLEGKKGLLKEIKGKVPPAQRASASIPGSDRRAGSAPGGLDRRTGSAGEGAFAKEKIANTLSYLGNLSGSIPDRNLFTALKQKVQSIMARIKAVTDKRQNRGK